jgi:FAD/FMN-containing dehydrogenase
MAGPCCYVDLKSTAVARQIARRVFLRSAVGVVGAGAVFRPGRATAVPAAADWGSLAGAIEGRVILPSDSDYASAKSVFNVRLGGDPAAVVAAKSTSDVQHAVAFAATNGYRVAARSGGHSLIGASAASGALVIDVRQLPGGVSYDDGSGLATVAAGADLHSVQAELAAHGRSIPTGTCPTVGVAGLALGGGLGPSARAHGLTCDMLASASVVLPSGEAVTVSSADHDDLYWGLRGGGGGNFGVTTSFTFQTFAIGDSDVASLVFPAPAAAQMMVGWNDWLSAADRAVWSTILITSEPGQGLDYRALLVAPAGAGTAAAADLIAATGVQPVSHDYRTLSHLEVVDYLAPGPDASRPRGQVGGSDIITALTPAAAEAIVSAVSAWPTATGFMEAIIDPLSGAVTDVDGSATVFPWRSHAANVLWDADASSPAAVTAAQRWLAAAHQAVRAHSAGGYINYIEENTAAARYFAGNVGRLSLIRQKYDPGALMYSGLSA